MNELHRDVVVSSLICILLCGSVLSKSLDDSTSLKPESQMTSINDVSGIHNTHTTSSSSGHISHKGDKKDSKGAVVAASTPPGSSVTEVVNQEYRMNGMSMVLMLAMIGVAVGTTCALGTVAVIFMIRRRVAANKDVTRKLAQRTNMYVIRNENCDLNKTLSGIPSVTDMWKELHMES